MGDIYTNPPQSRNEAILRATIDGTEYEAPPQSRMEDLLVELKAAIEQGACTGSYNDLNNKPQINGVTLQGDQSISDLFDGKVDIGVGTVEESGYAELKDENGDRIFRASSANGGASVESGALIGQSGALVLYNGEGGLGSVCPKGGASLVEVDLPAESGTLALDSQIASSQTPARAAVVTVNDAAPINAEDITVDITPIQDLHGYDRPWAGGAGKNKLQNTGASTTNNGVTSVVNADGSETLNRTSSSENWAVFDINTRSLPAGSYKIVNSFASNAIFVRASYNNSGGTAVAQTSTNAVVEFTISQTENVYFGIFVRPTATPSNLTVYPMLLLGTETDTTWSPYSNICPIEGRTGAELDRVGKNWFDKTSANVGYLIWDNGTINTVGNSWRTSDYIIAKPNSNYVLSGFESIGVTNHSVCYYDENKNYLSGISLTSSSMSFTTPSNVYYMRFDGKTDDMNTIQCELGSTATAYEPYQGEQYTADFGETVYGGKWHVTDGGTDKTHANIASYNGETINEPWLSSLDEYVAGATPTTGAQVVYPLTTPTAISTPKQNVPMLQGINTISADCGDVSLKYQPDNVIGELKGEIQELESELDKLDKAYMASDTFSERGIDGEYQITRISNEIHIAVVIDDASIATQTGSVDLIVDLPDEFRCNPSYGAVLALRHSSGTGKIEFKINPGTTTQNFYMYVEEVNNTSGVWFPIYDVPGKAL